MAYNQQSSYGAIPGNARRPQQRTYEAQQQYTTKHNNHGTGDHGFDFDERPVYDSKQPFVNERYGPRDGNIIQHGANTQQGRGGQDNGRGYDGALGNIIDKSRYMEQGPNGNTTSYGNMRRIPPQQRPFEPERRPYADPRSHGPSQPYHPLITSFGTSQINQHNQPDGHGRQYGRQDSQTLQKDLPIEPNFDEEVLDEEKHGLASNQGRELDYNQSQFHPQVPQQYTNKDNFKSANHSERYTADIQQQSHEGSYSREIFHGSSDQHIAHSPIGHSQPPINTHNSQAGRFQKPPPRKILTSPSSPESVSWDGPFPSFGPKKKTFDSQNLGVLNHSIAATNLSLDSHHDGNAARRPQTGNSKGSQSSSFKSDQQQYSTSTAQRPMEAQIMHQMEVPHTVGRRSEDTRIRPSFPSSGVSTSDSQRSRTMPSNMSEAAQGFSSLRRYDDQPAWQEPGPTAGYHGPEAVAQLASRSDNKFQERPVGESKPSSNKVGIIQTSEGLPAIGKRSHSQHSAHNSLGEFYDSYYHGPQHEQHSYEQDELHQPPHSPDDEMPNFDAVPKSGHRRGMTIDFHLEPQLQQIGLEVLPSSTQAQHGNTLPLRPGAHIAGQFNRSKSQPNLKDQTLRGNPSDNGFVFDLPGDAPPIPPISPLRTNFGQRNIVVEGQQDRRIHSRDNDPRPPINQQGVSPDVRPNGRAILNQSYQTAFQNGTQSERYRSPPLQSGNIHPGQIERPGSRPNQTNMKGSISPHVPPPNPDALPPHPAPVRLGLMQAVSSPQAAKPPPIRQYNNSLSHQQPGASGPSNMNGESVPVTFEELERLRQVAKSNPSDQKTQLLLAKKMVEASSALVADSGRADQKTRNKNREKYIFEAHKIIKKLVSNRFTEATFYLADCYSRGALGLEIDTKEAFNLYQTAAKSGHAQAAYRVAVCCEMGQEEGGGTRRDPSKAMQWYQRAATLGDTPAMYKIGIIQLKGLLGQPKNPQEALRWLKMAADKANKENPHALHELGLLYEGTGANAHVAKDDAYSKQLFTQAADLGYKFSQFHLGCAYEYGLIGCPIDPRQSIAWYSKAAVQEEHQSELALSGWYLTGSEGVLQQSDTEAYLWARKAAQAGLAKAEYAMGYFTEVGIGAPANLEDAKRWYWRSASQNFPKARDRLEALRKGGAKMEKSRVSRSAIRKQTEGECIIM